MVLTSMVAGALEMILAEEDCYPQFHSKYFMSECIFTLLFTHSNFCQV